MPSEFNQSSQSNTHTPECIDGCEGQFAHDCPDFVSVPSTLRPMFPYAAHADTIPWQPGPFPGVELKVLHRNPLTGGVTVLRRFSAGVTVPAHVHPLANEIAYVIKGEWVEDEVTYGPGTCFFAPKGERHGPHVARGEVISLTVFDGPLKVS